VHRRPDLLPEFSQLVRFRPTQIPQSFQTEPVRVAGRGLMAGDITVQPFGEIALETTADFPILRELFFNLHYVIIIVTFFIL
jgi:hypothetical protein